MSTTPPPIPGAPPATPLSPVKKPIWKRWWFITTGIAIVIGIVGSLAAPQETEKPKAQDTPTETPSSTPSSTPPTQKPTVEPPLSTPPAPPSFRTFEGDGTFAVPGEVKPGTYRTREGSSGCYWARLKNFEGDLESINANDNTDFPAVVTITKQDKGFESTNCGEWTSDLSAITTSRSQFDDGDFIVNTDMKPGTYKSSGGDGCYWARVRDFKHGLESIIANDNTDKPTIVTIKSTDKGFVSRNCGNWKRV